MIASPICDLLGIEYPILQGGMAWVSDAALACAVSNAGGLGILSAMSLEGEALRQEIRRAKAGTDRPFGVNIMLMSPHVKEVAQVVAEEQVPVVTTGAGNPGPYMAQWLEAGIRVIPVIASVAMAVRAARSGACALVAEGGEAGGHVGDLTTLTLVPQVCDAVSIPVIAAGGIGDGRAMAAALLLGASGVQMGTRFLVAKECGIHSTYKKKVLEARDIDTIVTGKRLGHPVRSLKSPFTQDLFHKEYDTTISNEELEALGSGALYRAARKGDAKTGCFMAGQCAALVKKEQTAQEILLDVTTQAEAVLSGAGQWLR